MPKAQRLYANVVSGKLRLSDSWAKWPELGYYRPSTGKYVKLKLQDMRLATDMKNNAFARAKRCRVEISAAVQGGTETQTPQEPRQELVKSVQAAPSQSPGDIKDSTFLSVLMARFRGGL